MKKFEATANQETISEFTVKMMSDKENGKEFTREYLKAKFLSSVGRSLYYARRQAGLTQTQLAEQLHTTQSAIARFEADKNGTMSFRRYADFAIACGMMPRSLMIAPILESIESLRDEMIARARMQHAPESPSTAIRLRYEPICSPPNVQAHTSLTCPPALPSPTLGQVNLESTTTANSADRWLRSTNAAPMFPAQSTA